MSALYTDRNNSLIAGQNLYFYLNHPIRWIRLVGVIVAVDVLPTRWILLLDDSSGATLEITCRRPTVPSNHAGATLPGDGNTTLSKSGPPTEGLTATGRKIDLGAVDIGTVVKVKGGIGSFRDAKQLLLERISILHSTNEEAAAWAENTAFHEHILGIPWRVNKDDEERAKKRAEGLERGERAKWKRKKYRMTGPKTGAKSGSTELKCARAQRKKEGKREAHIPVAEKEKLNQQQIKRAKEKKLRMQEFERLKTEKENMDLVLNGNKPQEQARMRNTLPVAIEEKQRPEGHMQAAPQTDRKEQARMRREEERRLRELEYQRLRTIKD